MVREQLRSLSVRLLGFYLVAFMATTAVASLFQYQLLRRQLYAEVVSSGHDLAQTMQSVLEEQPAMRQREALQSLVRHMRTTSSDVAWVGVASAQGYPLATSGPRAGIAETRDSVDDAGGVVVSRGSAQFYRVSLPVRLYPDATRRGHSFGWVTVEMALSPAEERVHRDLIAGMLIFSCILFLSAGVPYALTRRQLVLPLIELEQASRRFGETGELVRVEVPAGGELRALADAIYRTGEERKLLERELQQREQQLAHAQEIANVGSWQLELATEQMTWSLEQFHVLGLTPHQAAPSVEAYLACAHPEDRASLRARWEAARRDVTPFEFEHRVVGADGAVRNVLTRGEPICEEDGRAVRLVGVSQEVTEHRLVEQALRTASEAAEAANQAKSDFLANMSHEIRTPMNGVMGMIDLVLETSLDAEQRDLLGVARGSAESLLSVIDDVLDFSKIEAGRLDLEAAPFEIGERLSDLLGTVALRGQAKGLEMVLDLAPEVPRELVGDSGRLRQVVMNLVGNAIKFTERGEIVVRVIKDAEDAEDVMLQFSVSDTGIGMPQEKQSVIFDAFVQADTSTTRTHGGTGLGLAISARLVDLMGGRIWVESRQRMGSTFHFTAKFARAATAVTAARDDRAKALAGRTVLVVDDNAASLEAIRRMLQRWGARPILAKGGVAALAALEKAPPVTVALIDRQMPEMDGFALLAALRQHAKRPQAFVMMLTGPGRREDAARCRQEQMPYHVIKPLRESALLDAATSALGEEKAASPLANSPADRAPDDAPSPRRATRPLRVLLAEDNAVNRKLATTLLERRGHSVTQAQTGRDALASIERGQFDVVLMDVQMPDMDGLQATGRVRERERSRGGHLPIIAMTAHAMAGDRERCLAAGMDAYVSKPIDIAVLLDTIAMLTDQAAPEAPAAPAPVTGVIDEARLWDMVSDDPALLKEVRQLFEDGAPRLLQDMRTAIEMGNAQALEDAAHSLKGSAGSLTGARVSAAALQLEIMGRTRSLGGASAAYDELAAELRHFIGALDALQAPSLT